MYLIPNDVLPERLREEGLKIVACPADELPDEYVEQLVQKSRQAHIQEFEGHEDTEGRFKDVASFREWAEGKQRIMYLLVDESGDVSDVGGVIWFGERANPLAPGYDVTFAIRLYDGDEEKGWARYLGRGLAVPFMQAAHADARKHFPGTKVWLDYVDGNQAAEKTYAKFGYEKIASEAGRTVMGHNTALAVEGEDE